MLTRIRIANFKRFGEVEVELGNPVVLIGPNNSGKTTTLQALALWDIGLRRWGEKRGGAATPEKRPGVTINRRDLIAVPVPSANLLWRGLHVRDVETVDGRKQTLNIRVDITVEGVTGDKAWTCGLEFDYANEESFYCRPLRLSDDKNPQRMAIPEECYRTRVAFLQPMSGLAANEDRLDPGAINVRLGEGRTAEVLRNLCFQILMSEDGRRPWKAVCDRIQNLFGVALDEPTYVAERGQITMSYRESSGVRLDLTGCVTEISNVIVNDRTGQVCGQGCMQSETSIAVLGSNLVIGYNDSEGLFDRTQGLAGYSYSTDGGLTWTDGGGLPRDRPG